MTNLEFIDLYKNMKTIKDFCDIIGVNYSNLVHGKSTKENEAKIATLCKFEIIRLNSEVMKDNVKTDSL